MLNKYKECVSKSVMATWYIFGLLVLVLFAKNVLFNWLCFSSEEDYFMSLLMALPQKIVPALLIASFVFVTKRPIWTIVANLLVDIWIIANLFYFKANGYFLAYEVMTMVGNMDGFWDSLWSYMGWDIAIFPILTLIYALLIPYNYDAPKKYKCFVLLIVSALVINIGDQALHKAHKAVQARKTSSGTMAFSWSECMPFSHVYTYADAEWVDYNYWAKQYIQKFSIVSYFPACLMYRCISPMEKLENITIDASRIKPFLNGRKENITPRTNIVFILFESLESWPLDPVVGVNFMPNLNTIMRDEHALCCRNMHSQTVNGNSGDGQLIDMTGLLPITDGVVCNSYYRNAYPSIAQCYDHSAIINPSPGVWNQEQMTKAYHFEELIEPHKKEKWQDADVANRVIQYMDTASQPFCLLGITISSHLPFAYGSEHPQHIIDGMPRQLNAYLNCLAYADSCIGAIYHHIMKSPELANSTTLVISGDHTIFRSYNKEFDHYAAKVQLDFRTTKTHVPLIVYSPSIESNIQISDTCYQIDIYPTMMGVVGCKDYYWKGFGVDLTQPEASNNRQLSEEEAYQLSSQLIKSNYFSLRIPVDE